MILMNESEFVAHALTDYLSSFVDRSLVSAIHQSLVAGESESAIGFALGIAASEGIPIPSLMREKILSIPNLSTVDQEWFNESLQLIPVVELAA